MIKVEKITGGLSVAMKGDHEEIAADMYHIGRAFTTDGLNDEHRRMTMLTMFLDGFEATEEEVTVALNVAKLANKALSTEDQEQESAPEEAV